MAANAARGEIEIVIDGAPRLARLTLGALAELESELGAGGLVDLVDRFEAGACGAGDIMALIAAGLRGGGGRERAADVGAMAFDGGPAGAARAAVALLAAAFPAEG